MYEKDCDVRNYVAYVDGSYEHSKRMYAFACIIIDPSNNIEAVISETGDESDIISMRNVAGELKGAIAAMKYANEKGIDSITIYYDYSGIEKWCTGEWKTKKPFTTKYKAIYDLISKNVKISFAKVKAHSGDEFNEMVDKIAKNLISFGDKKGVNYSEIFDGLVKSILNLESMSLNEKGDNYE